MEWVRVEFPHERDVVMDGSVIGSSNRTLLVSEGTHRFHLGEPRNYAPKHRKVQVTGTSPLMPKVVAFQLA